MQHCTGHWNPFAGRRPALGTGVPAEGRHWPALGTGVPGRRPARRCPFGIVCILGQITDLIHQVYLVQEYVDSFDEDTLLGLLDMEKAFDRCSWDFDFLKKSMQALGLGKDIRRWIHAIYDNERPPERKKMNGEKSYQFALPR